MTPPAVVVSAACHRRDSPLNLPTGNPRKIVPPANAASATVWAKLMTLSLILSNYVGISGNAKGVSLWSQYKRFFGAVVGDR